MAFPKNEADVNALLQIWSVKLTDHQSRYGLTGDQIKQVEDDAAMYSHLILVRNFFEEEKTEFSTYKKNMMEGDPKGTAADYPTISLPAMPSLQLPPKPGIEKRNSELYNYLKNHPNRTAESLAELGIGNTPSAPISPESLKPKLSGEELVDDKVEISFNKQGMAACRIQRRRGGGDWEIVGDPTNSPFVDDTPSVGGNPEKREYRGIYLEKNQPVGQYSDIITVYTKP